MRTYTRFPLKTRSIGPFAETYPETYVSTYPETYEEKVLLLPPPDIFDPVNLPRTIWHIHEHTENPFYGLGPVDIEIVDELLDQIQFLAEASPGMNEHSASVDDNEITITKAIDSQSTDFHLSYNKVTLTVNHKTIEWYFVLTQTDVVVEGDQLTATQKDPGKREILYEKSESNKSEFNNTGYKFWWSDGTALKNNEVTPFIREKKKAGDQNFIQDFPIVKNEGEQAPTYAIPGSKYIYYAFDFRLNDPLEDKDNLTSGLFSGVTELEHVYDGNYPLDKKSPSGEHIIRIKQGLNLVYKDDKTFIPLEETSIFDTLAQTATIRFQKDNSLKSKDGIIGSETIKVLDSKVLAFETIAKEPKPALPTDINPTTGLSNEVTDRIGFNNVEYFPNQNDQTIVNDFSYTVGTTSDTWETRYSQFINGTGPTNIVYGPDHPFTQSMRKNPGTADARVYFYKKYFDAYKNGTFQTQVDSNQVSVTNYGVSFGASDVVDAGSDMERQFVGSYRITIYPSADGKRLIYILSNTVTKHSYQAHGFWVDDVPRTEAEGGEKQSTLLNLYMWSESLDFPLYERLSK